MNAAVVADTARPPAFGAFADPVAQPDEVLVRVRYAAQSSLAKAQASGKHYASQTTLPFVPGIDGVGMREDGTRVYFAFPRSPFGSMAERVAVRRENTLALPDGLDDIAAAASGNPGMSSVAALVERAHFVCGESVMINGATGVAGRLAVRVAKALGAKHVVATGRNRAVLEALRAHGADETIALDAPHDELVRSYRNALDGNAIDVVLDYLWGAPALALIEAIAGTGGARAEPRIRFVQIGSSAGAEIALSAKTLRSSGVELLGSGLGSISHADLVRATGTFFEAFAGGGFTIDTVVEPIAEVELRWNARRDFDARVVFAL